MRRAVPLQRQQSNTREQAAPAPRAVAIPLPVVKKTRSAPDVIFYIDVDNSGQKISDWKQKLESRELRGMNAYVVFVMNQCSLEARSTEGCNLQDELLRASSNHTNTATIVTPAYPEEADNVIEGHLRQMMRLKEFKRVNCDRGELKKLYGVDRRGYYFNDSKAMKKRCQPMAADASSFVIVSDDKDFQGMVKELLFSIGGNEKPLVTVVSHKGFDWQTDKTKKSTVERKKTMLPR